MMSLCSLIPQPIERMDFRSIKGDPWLVTAEAFAIYGQCMFQPEFEKYCKKIADLSARQEIYIFAAGHNAQITGIIALEKTSFDTAEIVGIAVKKEFQRCGIGKNIVLYAAETLDVKILTAETDEDSVGFYSHSGFTTTEFIRHFSDGDVTRYNCVLPVKK